MKLTEHYSGADDPFEGDRTLELRSLPVGVQVTKAAITLTPAASWVAGGFRDTFTFATTTSPGQLPAALWGLTKTPPGAFVEVAFHVRRTLAQVTGSGGASTLQVEMGGAYIGIADDGTFMAPDKNALSVTLALMPAVLPGLTVSKFKLMRANGNANPVDVTTVNIRSVPTNVSVRLGQMPPFWTRPGELSTADTSPDFAAVLNAFLADVQPQHGFYVIPVVVHSDTLAHLDVELALEFVVEQPILPPYLPEITLPYNFSTLPGANEALTTVLLPRATIPVAGRTGASIRGEFQPTRIALGPMGEEPTTIPVVVSPVCSLAQPLRSDTEITAIGVDLPLANTQPDLAGLNVTIQGDADGKPFGEVLTSAEVRVDKPLPGQSSWGSATLLKPFRILPGVRYWLVLQSRVGEAYWSATQGDPSDSALQCSRDGGLSWREATTTTTPPPLAARFRLRHTPERFSIPVQLQIGKGPAAVRRRLDEFAPLGRVEFRFDFAEELAEHLSKPAFTPPCGQGELLINGSFDQPLPDDATRRLFGFDAEQGSEVIGTVDLSRGVDLSLERFIMLTVDDGPLLRIDCAGSTPSRTTLDEIIGAINRTVGSDVAFEVTSGATVPIRTGRLGLRSLTEGSVQLHRWRELRVPEAWQGTPGGIVRTKWPGTDRLTAALQAFEGDAAFLAQRVPATGGCTYMLRFRFAIFEPAAIDLPAPETLDADGFAAPRWEVRWLGAEGQVVQEERAVLVFPPNEEGLAEGEARLVAPASTTQAEIRFVQPPQGFLLLDDVSFRPTLETLANGDLRLWRVDADSNLVLPLIWTLVSGWVDRHSDGARLRGDGPEDTILSQLVEVVAGKSYELRVRVRSISPSVLDPATQPMQQRPRLELHWLGNGTLGSPVVLFLDGRGFPPYAWVGASPAGVTQVEIRLIQPQGQGDLLVESVSLTAVDRVDVPLLFLAEAPGELTIADLRVAYDLPGPTAPSRLSTGAGLRRRTATAMLPPPVVGPLVPAVVPQPPLAILPSLIDIRGIGEARARRLADIGIDSLAKLAAAVPEDVSRALRGVSVEIAAGFIAEAKQLLASMGGP